MVCKTHTYANGGQIKAYADGGQVKKLKPHTPAKVKSPILEKAPNPGGEQTPGAKAKAKAKKMADGGPVKKKKAPRKPKPSDLGTGLAATAASELQNRRKQQMKDLDI